jgi:type IV secretory pathway VirB10-like protein
LASVVNQVKGATLTDEKLDTPIPAAMAKEVQAISALLTSVGEKYPTPKSKAEEEVAATPPAASAESTPAAVPPPAAAAAPAEPPAATPPAPAPSAEVEKAVGEVTKKMSEIVDTIAKFREEVITKTNSVHEAVKKTSERVERLEKSETLPNSEREEIAKRDQPVSWPMDMNNPRLNRAESKKRGTINFFED